MVSNAITRIIDTARIRAPGALDGVMRMEFYSALDEFFKRSQIWRQTLQINIQAGYQDYDLVSADHGFIDRLMGLSRQDPDNRDLTFAHANLSPREGELVRPGANCAVLRVARIPQIDETWYAILAMTVIDPTDDDGIPVFPDWIAEKYREGLIDGILSKLMAHPAKPYSNKELAMFHGRKFNSAIGTARTDARHGNTYGSQRWAFPQQFRSRTQRMF